MDWLLLMALWMAEVEKLGSPIFKTREAAQAHLLKNLDAAIPAIMLAESNRDPEVHFRCRLLVNEWLTRHAAEIAEAHRPRRGWPQIDWGQYLDGFNEPSGEQITNRIYLDKANAAGFYNERGAREAIRLRLIDMIIARQPWQEWLAAQVAFDRELRKKKDGP